MKETFTYEIENKETLETYEWDNIWWEHAENSDKDRVLIIGDSISCGYRGFVNEYFSGEVYADGIGTSKNLGNSNFISLIDYVCAQQKDYKAILFNNGLHGWNLSKDEYMFHFERVIEHIKMLQKNVQIIITLTTPIRKKDDLSLYAERNAVVDERNTVARDVAKKYNLKVNDLYSPIENSPELYKEDGVHLTDEGYKILAKKCFDTIKTVLDKKEK